MWCEPVWHDDVDVSVMVAEQALSAFCRLDMGPPVPYSISERQSPWAKVTQPGTLVSRAMKICEFLPVTLGSH